MTQPCARELFVQIMAKLEDMHAVALEGQSRDACPDLQRALLCSMRQGMVDLSDMIASIENRLR